MFPESQLMKAASVQLVHSLCLITGGDGTVHRAIHIYMYDPFQKIARQTALSGLERHPKTAALLLPRCLLPPHAP